MTSTGSRTVFSPAPRAGRHPFMAGLAALVAASVLAGCQSSGEGTGTSLFSAPPAVAGPPAPSTDELDCPRFDIFEGGSAIRSGDGRGLRHQLSIRKTARECFTHPDGSRTVNVGVEVLGLLGPAGSPGTFSAPLRIAVKRGDTTLDSRTRQISVPVPAGSAQNIVSIVEEGLRLPEDSTGVLIEIGLGSGPARGARR